MTLSTAIAIKKIKNGVYGYGNRSERTTPTEFKPQSLEWSETGIMLVWCSGLEFVRSGEGSNEFFK